MPIYEYKCRECGKEFEAMVWSREDEREIPCPHCGGVHPERLMSAFAACASPGSGAQSCTPFR